MKAKDIDAILEIERNSFSDPWSKRMFMSEMIDRGYNYTLVAELEDSNELVGYCLYWIIFNDETHITNLAVKPSFRRKGLARYLIDTVIEISKAKRIESVTLEVRESNAAARSFYESLGFIQVGRRKNYYVKPTEDALILRLHIQDATD